MTERNSGAVVIVGMGANGAESLSREQLRRVNEAQVLMGGERHLAFFSDHSAEKFAIRDNLKELAARLQSESRRVVVLASGDPLFYGIAGYLSNKIGRERLEVLPGVSSMQLAFARIKQSWQDAALASCHAKPIDDVIDVVRDAKKVGLFTDDVNTPARIARELLKAGIGGFRAYVCENLGGADERVTDCRLEELVDRTFGRLNVLVLVKEADVPVARDRDWTFGIPEEAFFQRHPLKGLITKTEVRVLSLSKMRLRPGNVVWDIGAGSGSVAIEAALLGARVWAIEKNREDCDVIRRNLEKFGPKFAGGQVSVIHGMAPAALAELPDPDAVFIGGSGGELVEIVALCRQRLVAGGRLVVNLATIENLAALSGAQAGSEGGRTGAGLGDVTLVQVSRSRPILDMHRFEALNPVWIVAWEKP